MSIGDWLVIVVTFLYASAAVAYSFSRDWPSVIVFTGYSIANIGVIWLTIGGKFHG